MPDKKTYRPDIDGLRAIAVLAVVIFHIEPEWMPGGFVGVDIFFVISGFLITGVITRQVEDGSFSFREFYRRRIRRILPVLTCVILVTLAVGQMLLTPEDLERLSVSALTSQLFFGNVYFSYFLDTGYFADDAGLEPLLHLWSLGVEEQFYLLWPMLLFGLLTLGRQRLLIGLAVLISAGSFFLPLLMPSIDRMFLYYMLPSRAGELLFGALCYFVTSRTAPPSKGLAQLSAWSGLSMLVLSLVLVSSENVFPGPVAIPVSLGTTLLIYAGTKENVVSRLLSVRIAVGIGLISYSMYLWHWPVLAYIKYLIVDIDLVGKALALIGIAALSYLSFRFVEQPFRVSEHAFRRIFVSHFLLPTMLISGLAGYFLLTGGYGLYGLTPDYAYALDQLKQSGRSLPSGKRICRNYELTDKDLSDPDCIINGEEEPSVLLWGDSKAAHYVGALAVLADSSGFSFRSLAHLGCPPLFRDAEVFTTDRFRASCRVSSELVRPIPKLYDTVMLSADWGTYLYRGKELFEERLVETVLELVNSGKQVIVLGVVPRFKLFDRNCDHKAIKAPYLNCRERAVVSSENVDYTNSTIRQIAESNGAIYMDFNDQLCKDGQCSAYDGDYPIYRSHGHISSSGSARLGQMLVGSDTASLLDALLSPRQTAPN